MNDLNEIDWENRVDSKGCEYTCNNITLTLQETITKYTELKRNKTNKNKLPWFGSSLWELMKQRDRALKTFLKSKLTTDHYVYKSLRNKVTTQLRKTKANFYLNLIKEAKENGKLLWKSMDKLLGKEKINCDHVQLKINGIIQNDNIEVATHFNDYFLDSVRDLANMFPKSICVHNFNCDKSFF